MGKGSKSVVKVHSLTIHATETTLVTDEEPLCGNAVIKPFTYLVLTYFMIELNLSAKSVFGKEYQGSRDGAVVRALAFHQCGPGSNVRPGIISGLTLLILSRYTSISLSPKTKI